MQIDLTIKREITDHTHTVHVQYSTLAHVLLQELLQLLSLSIYNTLPDPT